MYVRSYDTLGVICIRLNAVICTVVDPNVIKLLDINKPSQGQVQTPTVSVTMLYCR